MSGQHMRTGPRFPPALPDHITTLYTMYLVDGRFVRFGAVAGGHAVANDQPFGTSVHGDKIPIQHVTCQDHLGQRVLQLSLIHI